MIQVDCPEDASTYIHRVGRTARYEKDGESLLFLLPSEEYAMVKQLNDKKIPILKIEWVTKTAVEEFVVWYSVMNAFQIVIAHDEFPNLVLKFSATEPVIWM